MCMYLCIIGCGSLAAVAPVVHKEDSRRCSHRRGKNRIGQKPGNTKVTVDVLDDLQQGGCGNIAILKKSDNFYLLFSPNVIMINEHIIKESFNNKKRIFLGFCLKQQTPPGLC